ncbi:hypothetical protein [Corynebacterium dentalis]|uniref:hypothetical protein n=1 Tax=Corynebacterium dentalis TaxID=2014528 RepID=UPI002899B574|nr:hypothetical protein [Corynebacterium dentalis]
MDHNVDLVEVPASRFGRRMAMTVPADKTIRQELRLPARLVRELVLISNRRYTPISRIVGEALDYMFLDYGAHETGGTKPT